MSEDSNKTAIRKLYDDLCGQRDAILAVSTPLREKRDAIQSQIHPLEAQSKELAKEFNEVEKPLHDLCKQISALAAALGGNKKMSAGEIRVVDAETQAASQ